MRVFDGDDSKNHPADRRQRCNFRSLFGIATLVERLCFNRIRDGCKCCRQLVRLQTSEDLGRNETDSTIAFTTSISRGLATMGRD